MTLLAACKTRAWRSVVNAAPKGLTDSGGPPEALLLCSGLMFLAGTFISNVLTHAGQQSPPAPASLGTTHAPCLRGDQQRGPSLPCIGRHSLSS